MTTLKERNALLAADGKRECRDCGHVFRLNAENFHRRGGGHFRDRCKRCYLAYQRERYAADPDLRARANANSRRQYDAHHEERLAKQRAYAAKHRRLIILRKRNHYQENREAILADRRLKRAANRDVILARLRRQYQQRKARRFALVLGVSA